MRPPLLLHPGSLHRGCDDGRNRFVAAAKAAMSGEPTRLGGLYYRAGCFDSCMFVARRFRTTIRARIRIAARHRSESGKISEKSTTGIACESRRRGQQVTIIESRAANLRASAMVPCAWLAVRLSQKSHKAAVLLGITLLSALSLPDRREGGSWWLAVPKAVGALLGWFKGPLRPGVADATRNSRL